MDTVVCHQRNFERNALRHGQPVKSVEQCWPDVVISLDACDSYTTYKYFTFQISTTTTIAYEK